MGWRDWIKTFVRRDHDHQVAGEARGTSIGAAPSRTATPFEAESGGYDNLHEALAVDTDLMRRYADYENMDDYVETCLAGESLVFTVERGWVKIQELAETREDFHVLAYDRSLKSLVPAKAVDARRTGERGHAKPMVRVVLDGGREIRCTADHRFMRKDEAWASAADLVGGDRLMPVEHDLLDTVANHRVMLVEPIDGGEPVYDLTVPGYENFVCNGVVVHNSAALDIYADDCTIPDSVHGKTIWGLSRDRVIRDIIDDCMHRRLRIEEDIWVVVRTLCKYGNVFAEILVNEIGVVGLNWLPTPTMRRIVDEKGAVIGFVQDVHGAFNFEYGAVVEYMKKGRLPPEKEEDPGRRNLVFFYPWQVVHWRLRSKMMRAQYGHSVLDSARWIWKRLMLMEDTALVQKLTRAPGRFAFYVDTGDLPPREAMALVNKVKRGYKKVKLVDPTTGKLDFRYNPLSPHEDFWVATRGGKESTRIETISGPDVQMMDDVEYFRGKLISALKVPRSYLNVTGEGDTDKSLSQADVRFARSCMRIQREFIMGMRKVLRIHMAALNIDPESVDWKLKMTVPSAIFEMQQIEVMNAQAALADSMSEWASKPWILQHIFHFTEDDAAFVSRDKNDEVDADAKRDADTQADIMRTHPELQEMPEIGGDGGGPPGEAQESKMSDELAGLKKMLEGTSQTIPEVIKRVERLDGRMTDLAKIVRRRVISG